MGDRTCHRSAGALAPSCRSSAPSWPAAPSRSRAQVPPASVGIPGNYQSEAGCAGDWDPGCPATQLVYDANGDIWKNTFSISPAGGLRIQGGAQRLLGRELRPARTAERPEHPARDQPSRRRASRSTTTTRPTGSPTTSAPSSPRCPAASRARSAAPATGIRPASAPGCRTSTTRLSTASAPAPFPAGSYEAKVALNGSWDVNYGQGGVQNGPNIAFTVPTTGMEVVFQWNSTTKELRVIVGGIRGDLTKAQAYWLSADTIAWNVPDGHRGHAVRRSGRRAHARRSRRRCRTRTRSPGHSRTIPRASRPRCARRFPHLANLAAFKLPAEAVAAAAQSLKGQLAVGAARPGQGVDATSLQIPGVLDDLYSAKAAPGRPSGPASRMARPRCASGRPPRANLKVRLFADSASAPAFTTHADDARFRERHLELQRAREQPRTASTTCTKPQVYVRSTNRVETNVVTDPYSVSLARNSTRSQVVSLDDAPLQPRGWNKLHKPYLASPEDIVLYELHVRDFSATDADRAGESARHLSRRSRRSARMA